jgi:hypothetical protein
MMPFPGDGKSTLPSFDIAKNKVAFLDSEQFLPS